jgi:carbonic anhydrase
VTGNHVTKEIHSNKLRLLYQRRPCADLSNVDCKEPDPPYADFPNGWGGFADALHIDIKVPGEHRLSTERFDAEMQIFHIHPGRRRLPTLAVLIRAEEAGYNYYFQEALMAFQHEYDMNTAQCAIRQRRERQLISKMHGILGGGLRNDLIDFDAWAEFSTDFDRPDFEEHSEKMNRQLQSSWDPHHPMLVPSIHFYRYDGSLTEPPCGEFVSWFISDVPMIIDFKQLEQMKTILFKNYDSNCRKSSVHSEHSVARPIRPTGRRPVSKCTSNDFVKDP